MKKYNPVTKVKDFATGHSIKLSEKTFKKTEEAHSFFTEVADFFLFFLRMVRQTFSRGFEFKEFLQQCFEIGNKNLQLVSITGLIIGLVMTIQSRPALVDFGAVTMLPGMVAVSIIREMGPVITALI